MKKLIFILLSTFISLCVYSAESTVLSFNGRAILANGDVSYLEKHEVHQTAEGRAVKVITKYFRPDGVTEFASLESYFDSRHEFLPRTIFIDQRFNHKEEVLFENNEETLVIRHTNLETKKVKEERMKITEAMVHGQGYHNLVVKNLPSLKPKQKMALDFVVPSRRAYYRFDLTFLGKGVGVSAKSDWVALRLDINNWFLRMFADHISVEYDPNTRRLMTYSGLTNIPNDKGDNQSLLIRMEYAD